MIHVKMCGITCLEDALAAIDCGADLLGFNFYPPSPRYITLERCAHITEELERLYPQVRRVGVFVNLSVAEIRAALARCLLHLAQLHGDESPMLLAELGSLAYKALRGSALQDVTAYIHPGARLQPALLLDAQVAGVYGGSGTTADWESAAALAGRYPLLLAGGLNPGNVAAAVARVHPWGVDTASGVEQSPGIKDIQKMRSFIQAARSVPAMQWEGL